MFAASFVSLSLISNISENYEKSQDQLSEIIVEHQINQDSLCLDRSEQARMIATNAISSMKNIIEKLFVAHKQLQANDPNQSSDEINQLIEILVNFSFESLDEIYPFLVDQYQHYFSDDELKTLYDLSTDFEIQKITEKQAILGLELYLKLIEIMTEKLSQSFQEIESSIKNDAI
ncbi:MAG: hypothetical protein EBU93_05040 [Chlamydiae bacterium]|nr:hypothetical protein [Chlamydiota bacterium]